MHTKTNEYQSSYWVKGGYKKEYIYIILCRKHKLTYSHRKQKEATCGWSCVGKDKKE